MRLSELKDIVIAQNYELDELVGLLELTTEQILDRFPDILVENAHKFGVNYDHD